MSEFRDAFRTAIALLVHLDGDLMAIVGLSLTVSLSAVLLAAAVGLPLGAAVAVCRFSGPAGGADTSQRLARHSAGGHRVGRVSPAVARRTPRRARTAVHPDGHDDRPNGCW